MIHAAASASAAIERLQSLAFLAVRLACKRTSERSTLSAATGSCQLVSNPSGQVARARRGKITKVVGVIAYLSIYVVDRIRLRPNTYCPARLNIV